VEELRSAFAANRHKQKHSADELLRLQSAPNRRPLPAPLPATDAASPLDAPLAEDELVASLRGALTFYESLQAKALQNPSTSPIGL
jgi:cycloartenol synthase